MVLKYHFKVVMFFKYNSKLLIETISYGTQSQTHALWSRTVYMEWLEMYSGTRRFMEATTAMSS